MSERKKIGTESKIQNEYVNIKIGTTDKKIPSVIYVEGGLFISPQNECTCFNDKINNIHSMFNSIGLDIVKKNNFTSNFILNFEVANDRIICGKKTFLSFQYFFKQRNVESYTTVKNMLSKQLTTSILKMLDSLNTNGFEYSKTKK